MFLFFFSFYKKLFNIEVKFYFSHCWTAQAFVQVLSKPDFMINVVICKHFCWDGNDSGVCNWIHGTSLDANMVKIKGRSNEGRKEGTHARSLWPGRQEGAMDNQMQMREPDTGDRHEDNQRKPYKSLNNKPDRIIKEKIRQKQGQTDMTLDPDTPQIYLYFSLLESIYRDVSRKKERSDGKTTKSSR